MRDFVKHIFFDLDHTLWDFDKNSRLAFMRLFESFKIEIDLDAFLTVYEPINFDYWKLYRENRISKQELRRNRFSASFEQFNMFYEVQELDKLATAYIDELPKDNHLFDGVIEILDYLKSRYELHIITNGFEEVQYKKLHNSGISGYFNTVTTSEEVGLKKPHPVIFQKALEKAIAQPSESLMVGDTFEADILGAEGVGMHTLYFNYRNEDIPGHYRKVDHLLEMKYHL